MQWENAPGRSGCPLESRSRTDLAFTNHHNWGHCVEAISCRTVVSILILSNVQKGRCPMIRNRLSPFFVLLALSAGGSRAAALTGREVIDTAQQRNGFSTWRDRKMETMIESYSGTTIARTREATVTEQTDPRGEHRTLVEFTAPADS